MAVEEAWLRSPGASDASGIQGASSLRACLGWRRGLRMCTGCSVTSCVSAEQAARTQHQGQSRAAGEAKERGATDRVSARWPPSQATLRLIFGARAPVHRGILFANT